MTKTKSRGKSLMVIFILFLLLVTLCLLGGITATIPARTAELFGPPAPGIINPKTLSTIPRASVIKKQPL